MASMRRAARADFGAVLLDEGGDGCSVAAGNVVEAEILRRRRSPSPFGADANFPRTIIAPFSCGATRPFCVLRVTA
jgi:hypothetical protein